MKFFRKTAADGHARRKASIFPASWFACGAMLALALLPSFGLAGRAGKGEDEGWLPVDPQDLAMKSYAAAPGAHAVILYSDEERDEDKHTDFHYVRVKILDAGGLKSAEAEIEDPGAQGEVEELHARTIHPDGSIVEFTGQPVERWKRSMNGFRRVLAFTYPAATAGSIVEYRERVRHGVERSESFLTLAPREAAWFITAPRVYDWSARGLLFAREARFRLYSSMPDTVTFAARLGIPRGEWRFRTSNLPADTTVDTKQEDTVVCVARDVAPLPELYPPPLGSLQARIEHYYTRHNDETYSDYWVSFALVELSREAEALGSSKTAREVAEQAVETGDKPEEALRKLYARAQKIRNLSYGNEPTVQKGKRQPDEARTVDEVLKRGEGTSRQINLALMAMARGAKLKAWLLLLAPRNIQRFDMKRPELEQLSQTAVSVALGAQTILLDPGVPEVPFGKLPWPITGAGGFRVEKDSVIPIATPELLASEAGVRRWAELQLGADGALSGTMQVDYYGQEALELRVLASGMGEQERANFLSERFKTWLPAGSKITSLAADGWDEEEEPVHAQFQLWIPGRPGAGGSASVALTPTVAGQTNSFEDPERTDEADFPYPYQETDHIHITVPPGMHLEQVAPLRQARLRLLGEITYAPENGESTGLRRRRTGIVVPAVYENARVERKDSVTVTRKLDVLLTAVPASDYAKLREFFLEVQAWDAESASLRAGPAAD